MKEAKFTIHKVTENNNVCHSLNLSLLFPITKYRIFSYFKVSNTFKSKLVLRKRFLDYIPVIFGCHLRQRSQTKNTPPTKPVIIPIGMSSGAIIVRAAMSAHNNKIAPTKAETGRTRK